MAQNKTQPTKKSVENFLNQVSDEKKRLDAFDLLKLMKEVTGEKPTMWGDAMVGFGSYHYKYASGREGDYFLTGFSPRKQNLTVYIMSGFNRHAALMKKLGKYKNGSSCIYINKLEDVDRTILKRVIKKSVAQTAETYA